VSFYKKVYYGWMSSLAGFKAFFPNIFRFITERWKIALIMLVSIIILAGITSQSIFLAQNMKELETLDAEREELVSELTYWQQVVTEYKDYRDAYFRIATLEYQLGQLDEAKQSVEKVLGIDPNFENAKVLGERIEASR
jgi:tetratricopeptide (TPR) repeat protein